MKTTLELARKHPFIYAAVGVHPDEVGELTEENFAWLKEQCQDPKTVAVGETGLDYYWDKENHEVQKYWFRRQLELAEELELPIIVHSREACADTLEEIKGLLKEAGLIFLDARDMDTEGAAADESERICVTARESGKQL